jgi:hypothetical protein
MVFSSRATTARSTRLLHLRLVSPRRFAALKIAGLITRIAAELIPMTVA